MSGIRALSFASLSASLSCNEFIWNSDGKLRFFLSFIGSAEFFGVPFRISCFYTCCKVCNTLFHVIIQSLFEIYFGTLILMNWRVDKIICVHHSNIQKFCDISYCLSEYFPQSLDVEEQFWTTHFLLSWRRFRNISWHILSNIHRVGFVFIGFIERIRTNLINCD